MTRRHRNPLTALSAHDREVDAAAGPSVHDRREPAVRAVGWLLAAYWHLWLRWALRRAERQGRGL